jgi:hypothetical protein
VYRTLIAVVFVASVGAACTATGDTSTTTAPEPLMDRLVTATSEGEVVVYSDSLDEITRFTPVAGSLFRQPTWLDRDTVVFSELSATRDYSLTAANASTGETVWRSAMTSSPFFFAPAPSGSPFSTTSLRNNPGADLISELIDPQGMATELGTESPFYTTWSPSGDRIAIHIPGRRVDVVAGDVTETILEPSNGYQTPVWLDRGLLMLRDTDEGRWLTLWNDGVFSDVAEIDGSAIFVARGSMVAIKTTGEESDGSGVPASLRTQQTPTIPSEQLVAFDLDAGTFDIVTTEPTAVYQWDPTGTRLLFAEASFERGLAWSIWEEGNTTELAAYRPNRQWVIELVAFFDQYAQSVQFWSPSGNRVAVPVSVGGEPSVAVMPTDGSDPVLLSDAVWSGWVFE